MKLMIASDIHGSAYYCSRLLKEFEREKPDRLFLLGDILYHGPRNDLPRDYNPKEVIAMLNSVADRVLSVRGNCDSEVDEMVLNFPLLADYAVIYAQDREMLLTHGHIYNSEKMPPLKKGSVFISGHTHIPLCRYAAESEILFLNPGSVSIPKGGSENSYLIFENGEFLFKTLDGEAYNNFSLH